MTGVQRTPQGGRAVADDLCRYADGESLDRTGDRDREDATTNGVNVEQEALAKLPALPAGK